MDENIVNENWLGEMLAKALVAKGIPKQKHIAHIGKVLELTPAAAHKKLTGSTKWEVSQLMKVIHSIDMKMSEFFEHYYQGAAEMHYAMWNTENVALPCKIYLSPDASEEVSEYSAVKVNDEWRVIHTDELQEEFKFGRRNIESLVFEPKKIEKRRPRIAILDDDKNIVDSIRDMIAGDGFVVDAFYTIDELESCIDKNPYDAYILDWVVGNKTAFETIKGIRLSKNKNSMILILTGQLDGIVDEEISNAIHDYDIIGPYEKPVRINVIKSNIDKHFPK